MLNAATPRRALICGVSGQDGAYLAQLLLAKGYEVWGTSRDAISSPFYGLQVLGIKNQVRLLSMSLVDFRSVLQIVSTVRPNEIYNMAGQSSVGLSFAQPVETIESIAVGVLNLLEAVRFIDPTIHIFNAGSSECFGDTGDQAADEQTPFRPKSPYAIAKASVTWQVALYREAYGLFACTGILFNHESPLRSERFVTRKVVSAAYRISRGSKEKLKLGNLDICRDWGWAPDYVDAMWRILNHHEPSDFVIATGVTQSLKDFIDTVFREVDLNWVDHVISDPMLRRPSDLAKSLANPEKAQKSLSWFPICVGSEVPRRMIRAEFDLLRISAGNCTD